MPAPFATGKGERRAFTIAAPVQAAVQVRNATASLTATRLSSHPLIPVSAMPCMTNRLKKMNRRSPGTSDTTEPAIIKP